MTNPFIEREEQTLEFWKERGIFKKSLEQREGCPLFSFYDGPPFATGLPHYGHLLAGTIKDTIQRYKTMKGYSVPRRFGWDCHGLPVENEIEKSEQLSGAADIEEYGVDRFNEACREIVMRYSREWQDTVLRMGRWVDFDDDYRTMDLPFMETVWWVFKQLYEGGLVYEGHKVMPFSAKLGTPLSNFEAGENYKEIDDPSIVVRLPLVDELDTYILVWTTTPWTLPSNMAAMINPSATYIKIRSHADGKQYVLAEACLNAHFDDPSEYSVVGRMLGGDLSGRRYQPPFSYFTDRAMQGAFQIIEEESVSIDEGTGIVHAAPAFGEVDFYAAKRARIPLVCPVNRNGLFTKEVPEYEGRFVKDADKDLIRRLKEAGLLFSQTTYHHRYPFCWRSDTPLIYRAMRTWFISVENARERMVANNERVHWVPDHLRDGRFGNWLASARDWAISRNRYWGTPIPIWRAEDGDLLVIGSRHELEERTGEKITDLHRHFIDHLEIEHNGKKYRRIPEVFDCWFESGSMPYAQLHYPFENRDLFARTFPADCIAEGVDQTRGWFYTLMVLSTLLFDKPAFSNVVVNGIILAEDGAKMSKRLRNYPDPIYVLNTYGADAIRLYLLSSPAVRAEDLRFSERGVEQVLRKVLFPLWNAYSFFQTYAKIYKWTPSQLEDPEAEIDRWILSRLQHLVADVEGGMDVYHLSRAVEPFVGFIDQLTNWYIRRCRRRFWAAEESADRHQAFSTLYRVLKGISRIAAPFVPFIAEELYRNLRQEQEAESVHLMEYPDYNPLLRDSALEKAMNAVQTTVSLGHSLRKGQKIKVRQPLAKAHIVTTDRDIRESLESHRDLVAEELNVKEVVITDKEESFVTLKPKPNFRLLGKRLGAGMRAAQAAIEKMGQEQLQSLLEGQTQQITIEGVVVELSPEEVAVEREVKEGVIAANEGAITIGLDTALNEDLRQEGLAREIVNKVNTMRRDAGLEVSDRIALTIAGSDRVRACYEEYQEYIDQEVLALSVQFAECEGTLWDLNGESTTIAIQKAKLERHL